MAGQAAQVAADRLHWLVRTAAAIVVLSVIGIAALAWRLDQGPIDVPWIARRIEAAARTRGIPLQIGKAEIAWSAYSGGIEQPLQLTLEDLRAGPEPATLRAEQVGAVFALAPLLIGQFVPRGLEVTGFRADLVRNPDGSMALGTQPGQGTKLPNWQSGSAKSSGGPPDWLLLRHVHVHDAEAQLYDSTIGLLWRVADADADLDRGGGGLIAGTAHATIQAGDQTATLDLSAHQHGDASTVEARLTPLDPSALAPLAPAFAQLSMLQAPVSLTASAEFGTEVMPRRAHIEAQIGAGTLHIDKGTAPLLTAQFSADATPTSAQAELQLQTAAAPTRPTTKISGTMHATLTGQSWRAAVAADLDRVSFSDLPALWPEGTGGQGARPWITKNIPSGEMTGGHMDLVLTAPSDFADVQLASINAGIDGHDVTVWWLRPVPPIEHAEARMTVTDPDAIDITVVSARQAGGTQGGLLYSNGHVHIAGMNDKDQVASIENDLAGRLPDLIAVLKNPRVQLLNKRPVQMKDPAGQFTAHISVGHLLLRDDVTMDDLKISTFGHFTNVHLGGIVSIAGGRDLDHGTIDLSASNDGLHASGHADLAGIPSQLSVTMDFRSGKPTDVIQEVKLAGTADEPQLASLGWDPGGAVKGPVAINAAMRSQRNHHDDIDASADLSQAAVALPWLRYSKQAGQKLDASAHLTLEQQRLATIEHVSIEGVGIDVEGSADVADGRPDLLRFATLRIGADTKAAGTVRLPAKPGEPYVVTLSGPSLDASGQLEKAKGPEQPAHETGSPGPPWEANVHFDRVLLGHDRVLEDVTARASDDGRVIRSARLTGVARSGPGRTEPFHITITPQRAGRHLEATAPDAGGLLRALDVVDDVRGGKMTIDGHYDDALPDHPLSGTAQMTDFRVLDAPAIGRVLQAATLYGLVEVLRGPGLSFLKAVVPFRLRGAVLTLAEGRAYSASLGLTAKGDVDLGRRWLNLQGTVVPAYALNSLPGRIPLIGKLFSPERSGGVFAATYSVRGPFANPKVSVNPLAALTPGFLRGLFDLF
jgi:hypothetical protein